MRLEIKRILLDNFKGCSHREIELKGNTLIKGENGSGKSTIASAVMWLLADTDSNLSKNPNVVPLGQPECNISVEIDAEIDGTPIKLKKMQKYHEKTDDNGKVTSSVTNKYAINGVEKSFTNFNKDLNEKGLDLDKYIILSNPNAFLADTSSKGREKIREILFEMVGDVSDKEIALNIGAEEVANLLSTYTLEEVKAMQKSTIKSIKEQMGSDNDIINSKIDGLLSTKSNTDVKVLEEQKANYEAEIKRIDSELQNISNGKVEIQKKISELHITRDKIATEANLQLNKDRGELEKQVSEMKSIAENSSFNLNRVIESIEMNQKILSEINEEIETQRAAYLHEQALVLDESELCCPVCKREYPADRVESIKADFEKNKTKALETIKSKGEELKAKIKGIDAEINELSGKKENLEKFLEEHTKLYEDAQKRLNDMPACVDLTKNDEYVEMTSQILALSSDLAKSDDSRKEELEDSKGVARQMLNKVIGEIAIADKDKDIDIKVEELRKLRKQSEINKANAEKILYQAEQVEMAKNKTLTESINKYFSLVEFVLFKRLKNGSIEPTVEVLLDGKPLSSAVNGSHILLGKLDIIEGLSNFYNLHYPVFADDAALLTQNVTSRINLSSQTIYLIAENGAKELKIEYV